MKFVLLIFSFVAKQFLHRTSLNGRLNKNTDGCDHRYFTTNESFSFSINNTNTTPTTHEAFTSEDMYRFNCYFYKFKLLKKLTSPELSEPEKLAEIERYEGYNNNSKYKVDLTAGGLYKDWETTIS
jgi:hypothetical protein